MVYYRYKMPVVAMGQASCSWELSYVSAVLLLLSQWKDFFFPNSTMYFL